MRQCACTYMSVGASMSMRALGTTPCIRGGSPEPRDARSVAATSVVSARFGASGARILGAWSPPTPITSGACCARKPCVRRFASTLGKKSATPNSENCRIDASATS